MRNIGIILVMTALLLGCALNKPINPSQFMFRCSMASPPGQSGEYGGSCGEQQDICLEFQTNLLDLKDGDSCIETCRETKNHLYQRFVTDTCRWNVRRAYDLCTVYCMSNYN